MCETFGQNLRRSILERFHLFMNCCNMFFHVILDLSVSDTAQTLVTRIVWCFACVWDFWARSEAFSFWKVSPLHELLQRVLSCYSWLKIECLRTCWKFGYQNSLMLCLCVRLLVKIRDVQFLSFIFRFCFKKFKKKIENWISQMLLKLWLPE